MNITEVKIYKLNDNNVLALATITIDNELVITGLKILKGQNGLFVAMPSKKNAKEDSEKKYYDIAFPITRDAREVIQQAVLDKFQPFNDEDSKDVYNDVKNAKDRHDVIENISEDDLPF